MVRREGPLWTGPGAISGAYIDLTVTTETAGTTIAILAPSAGLKLRIYYLSVNPSVASFCMFSLLGAGDYLGNRYPVDSVVAKDFNDGFAEGLVGENLKFYAAVAGQFNINVHFQQV